MKRFALICISFFIFSILFSSAVTASQISYSDSYVSISPANRDHTRAKILRTSDFGNFYISFFPDNSAVIFDSLTFYIDISSYSGTKSAEKGVVLPFGFSIKSNGESYRFYASLNEIQGYSGGEISDTLNFTKSGPLGYNYCGFITLSASAFVSSNGKHFSPGSEIESLKMSVSPTTMSDFYFIMGDVYTVNNRSKSIFFKFKDIFIDSEIGTSTTTPTAAETTYPSSTAVLKGNSTDVQTQTPALTFTQTTDIVTSQSEDNTQATTKFKGSGKSYITETQTGYDSAQEENTETAETAQGTAQTIQKSAEISDGNNYFLPFAGVIVFIVIVSSAIIVIHHGKVMSTAEEESNLPRKQDKDEVKDEKL